MLLESSELFQKLHSTWLCLPPELMSAPPLIAKGERLHNPLRPYCFKIPLTGFSHKKGSGCKEMKSASAHKCQQVTQPTLCRFFVLNGSLIVIYH